MLKSDLSESSIFADSCSRSAYMISFNAFVSSVYSTLSRFGMRLAGENSDGSRLGDRELTL